VRGQRLFVRPIESSDAEAIRDFLDQNAECGAGNRAGVTIPACGLLGKLVGDLVGVIAIEIAGDGLRIENVVVARELRRKRIGRFLVDEASRLAQKIDRDRLLVADARGAEEFLRRVGFEMEDGVLVRRVR
jgi:N-acetylglutamate synthase-like GNAT family acetyltransferase